MPYANLEVRKAFAKRYRDAHRVQAKIYMYQWRSTNASKLQGYRERWDKNIRKPNHDKVIEYFKTHPCVDCGESDPVVLQFDHTNPLVKRASVSRLIDSSYWENVLKEIDKCVVRCANCHTRRTASQRGWWKAELERKP